METRWRSFQVYLKLEIKKGIPAQEPKTVHKMETRWCGFQVQMSREIKGGGAEIQWKQCTKWRQDGVAFRYT